MPSFFEVPYTQMLCSHGPLDYFHAFILLSMDYGRIDLGGHYDGLYCGNVYNYLVTGIIFSDQFSLSPMYFSCFMLLVSVFLRESNYILALIGFVCNSSSPSSVKAKFSGPLKFGVAEERCVFRNIYKQKDYRSMSFSSGILLRLFRCSSNVKLEVILSFFFRTCC